MNIMSVYWAFENLFSCIWSGFFYPLWFGLQVVPLELLFRKTIEFDSDEEELFNFVRIVFYAYDNPSVYKNVSGVA